MWHGHGTVLSTGTLVDGDGHTRTNPEILSVHGLAVRYGDVLELQIVQDAALSTFGEMAGVKLKVKQTSIAADAEIRE